MSLFIYLYIRYKWSTTDRVFKSHRSKMGVVYMQLWKQCALPVITAMALCQIMHLGTWCTVQIYNSLSSLILINAMTICSSKIKLPKSIYKEI